MNEQRIVVVFRADLPEMTRAKSEVQFGHAVEGCLAGIDGRHFDDYYNGSRLKLSMEVDSLEDLLSIAAKAADRCVLHHIVTDAGRTCFSEPTTTCVGIGPMSKTDSNAITRAARMRT